MDSPKYRIFCSLHVIDDPIVFFSRSVFLGQLISGK